MGGSLIQILSTGGKQDVGGGICAIFVVSFVDFVGVRKVASEAYKDDSGDYVHVNQNPLSEVYDQIVLRTSTEDAELAAYNAANDL
tara:strand:- start:550 stop:807 length:258 start_codon:yes stop_codon:yes gene_type:complete